ncbi:unnamed protein product [Clonostachys byssicola]|uniref:Isotrichodermin C-15 hydroxylase n=1 Tax=Clonostachys byssicola TaxID=160290 RepID=A0A9N9XZR7_9HYPO|nr:unnamed protein product [Clonostachys byssicola]
MLATWFSADHKETDISVQSILYVTSILVYNIYFHPLRNYPGPKIWAASRIPYALMIISGHSHKRVLQLHEQYGEVVRIAPDELAFISPEAWHNIMGHRKQGQGENGKDPLFWEPQPNAIIAASRENHGRLRRVLAHGFSSQAIMDQQPLVRRYVDLLIERLRERCKDGTEPVGMVSWYNWTTFDIIGDLVFGESFGCLEGSDYHPWVKFIFDAVRINAIQTMFRRWTVTRFCLRWFLPKSLMERAFKHRKLSEEKVAQRLGLGHSRPDFMEAMSHPKAGLSMTMPEIIDNAKFLILAGSETTATALSGATHLLATHPEVLAKLEQEVRTSFIDESQIDLITVQRLDYMLAVLNEAMRFYPPVPTPPLRVTQPQGDTILGHYVPGGTLLGIWQWPMYHSPKNFTLPDAFAPERWLGDPRFAGDRIQALQPFSVGPRNCIGKNLAYAEMRMILARIIWNFDLRLVEPDFNWFDANKTYVLWEKPEYHMYLTPRDMSKKVS